MKYTEQILFALSFGVVFYHSYQHNYDTNKNIRHGLLGVLFVVISEGILKDCVPFQKFSTLQRGTIRFCFVYLMALVFLAFQNEKDARKMMTHLDESLGKPVPHSMHTYDDNCDLELHNLWDNLDHYYAIHLINWFAATMIMRDRSILHFWSILDEIIELSVQHILPHFRECWWDHIFVDILMSNTVSIEVGLLIIKLTGLKQYDWLGKQGKKSIKDWDCFNNHRRFGGLLVIFTVIIVNFCCGFFLINALWIPPKNYINLYRLLVWFLLTCLTLRELHNDIETWGTFQRIENPISGKCRWLTFFVMFCETFCCIKFCKEAGNIVEGFETPVYIWMSWLGALVLCLTFYIYLRLKKNRTHKYPIEYYKTKNAKNMNGKQTKEHLKIKKNK